MVTIFATAARRCVLRSGRSSLAVASRDACRSLTAHSTSTIITPDRRLVFSQQQQQQQRPFSSSGSDGDGSHSDFSPQRKEVKDDVDEAVELIKGQVKEHPVMLYMKGSPNMPMCGFSGRVVQVLKSTGADFSSVNVLDYPSIREGVKKYSDWPTVPQLYVDGEFVGGCDIIEDMYEKGELAEILKAYIEKEEEK
mmetsp:Transcript_8808/g.11708  ORF Transcript_8808/g.11708 Transcript_8808/m.11708 type:complete len:195 (+) Transcript_8808:112-696(+)|eukprot:CAMPEP_0198142266 /NCGR_PEP_ID=MMETSP1443-20131203/5099_1 /TAXON_ID=186043 /ORGANISM="Entomoneis sp., Strain CCMP2396" /LENGTH=194 /DNA_ID=CAMNT_0043805235 /DNA_START=98 /DNA_END=682 /DNA_ORIENTATION=+